MTLQKLIENAMGIWHLPEEDPLPRECPKMNCPYHGDRPVCYMIIFEECADYDNENI